MKKDKPGKPSEPEFNNNPFRSLRSLKAKPLPASMKKAEPRISKETKEEEGDLFLRAMAGARKIETGQEEPVEAATGGRPEPATPVGPDEQQVFLQAMKKIGTTLRETEGDTEDEAGPRVSASSRMKQLRRGMIRIQDELDLHGCLRDEALAKLAQFMNNACHRGLKAVLVITGKGINSPEGPVLQRAVADWLRGKGRGVTAEFGPAPRDKGGSGAFVVFLKKR